MTFDAVLLDLDGTLTDSAPGLLASLRHMHARMGWPVPPEGELRGWLGPPVVLHLRELGHDAETAAEGLAHFREHLLAEGLWDQRVYDGIPELLASLRDAGVPTSTATFKLQGDAETVVDHMDLRPLLTAVHGRLGDDSGESKAPVIRRALAELGVAPSPRVAMVGDRRHDVEAALEVGVTPIGAAYGYGTRDELEAAGAVAIAASVAELIPLLR